MRTRSVDGRAVNQGRHHRRGGGRYDAVCGSRLPGAFEGILVLF